VLHETILRYFFYKDTGSHRPKACSQCHLCRAAMEGCFAARVSRPGELWSYPSSIAVAKILPSYYFGPEQLRLVVYFMSRYLCTNWRIAANTVCLDSLSRQVAPYFVDIAWRSESACGGFSADMEQQIWPCATFVHSTPIKTITPLSEGYFCRGSWRPHIFIKISQATERTSLPEEPQLQPTNTDYHQTRATLALRISALQ